MYGAVAEEDGALRVAQVEYGSVSGGERPNAGERRSARSWRIGGVAALALALTAFVGAVSVSRSGSSTGGAASSLSANTAMGAESAAAASAVDVAAGANAVAVANEADSGVGLPFKITTALGEFYFIADTEGLDGMEPTIFQYLPNDFSGDAVTPIGGVLKRSLIPEFLVYCAKKIFFTTSSKVRAFDTARYAPSTRATMCTPRTRVLGALRTALEREEQGRPEQKASERRHLTRDTSMMFVRDRRANLRRV